MVKQVKHLANRPGTHMVEGAPQVHLGTLVHACMHTEAHTHTHTYMYTHKVEKKGKKEGRKERKGINSTIDL